MTSFRPFAAARTPRAFTLIELLVVMAIMAILASIAALAIIPLLSKSRVSKTAQTIRVIEGAFESFFVAPGEFSQRVYGPNKKLGYPKRDELNAVAQPGYYETAMCDGEFMRLLLAPTDDEVTNYLRQYRITSAAIPPEAAKESLNREDIDVDGRTVAKGTCFVDGWERTLHYRFPGEDHSKEKNFRDQEGANQSGRAVAGGTTGSIKPDIWSDGNDGENWYDITKKAQWASEPNDPNKKEGNDDITNWFPLDSY